jgi:cation:H+ antiporter
MIPLVYGASHLHHFGAWSAFHFDAPQRLELLLTLLQTALGVLVLANMRFEWLDAALLFVLWLVQFCIPHWRIEVAVAYGVWIVILLGLYATGKKQLLAWQYFWETVRH